MFLKETYFRKKLILSNSANTLIKKFNVRLIDKALLIAKPARPEEFLANTENNEAKNTIKLVIIPILIPSHL